MSNVYWNLIDIGHLHVVFLSSAKKDRLERKLLLSKQLPIKVNPISDCFLHIRELTNIYFLASLAYPWYRIKTILQAHNRSDVSGA